MKKYSKVVSFFLFSALAVFVLFQYQNCGSNNPSNNWSAVTASGLTYMVTMTPPTTSVSHGSAGVGVGVRVQVSGPETMIVRIGTMVNGYPNQMCAYPSNGAVTDSGLMTCYYSFNQSGVQQLYVQIEDPNFPSGQPLITCTNPPIPGCLGTYILNVQ